MAWKVLSPNFRQECAGQAQGILSCLWNPTTLNAWTFGMGFEWIPGWAGSKGKIGRLCCPFILSLSLSLTPYNIVHTSPFSIPGFPNAGDWDPFSLYLVLFPGHHSCLKSPFLAEKPSVGRASRDIWGQKFTDKHFNSEAVSVFLWHFWQYLWGKDNPNCCRIRPRTFTLDMWCAGRGACCSWWYQGLIVIRRKSLYHLS